MNYRYVHLNLLKIRLRRRCDGLCLLVSAATSWLISINFGFEKLNLYSNSLCCLFSSSNVWSVVCQQRCFKSDLLVFITGQLYALTIIPADVLYRKHCVYVCQQTGRLECWHLCLKVQNYWKLLPSFLFVICNISRGWYFFFFSSSVLFFVFHPPPPLSYFSETCPSLIRQDRNIIDSTLYKEPDWTH